MVESPEDIPHLSIRDPDKLVYLTQTTLSIDDANVVIAALKRAFPNLKEPPSSDICYATTNRQHAVRRIAPEVDLVLVIGSRNSSNSVRLTEISANTGTPAKLLDDVGELDWSWFGPRVNRVLVTAGASAPEDLVAAVCKSILDRFGGTIEQRDIFNEDVEFAPPGALRRIMETRGIDPETRRFRAVSPSITRESYGATPLTVSASKRS